jgi:amino acid permease
VNHRPSARRTVVALNTGTLVAVALFAAAFVIRLESDDALADRISIVAVIALLATPAAALVTSAFELRRQQRAAAFMAVLVLVVLAAATVLAVATR